MLIIMLSFFFLEISFCLGDSTFKFFVWINSKFDKKSIAKLKERCKEIDVAFYQSLFAISSTAMKSLSVKTLNAAMGVALMPEILILVHYVHVDN